MRRSRRIAGFSTLTRIEAETGLTHVHTDPAHRWGAESHGFLGTIVFLPPAARVEDVALLDLPGHCHRGAVIVDFHAGGPARCASSGCICRCRKALRVAQMRTIGQHLFRRDDRG